MKPALFLVGGTLTLVYGSVSCLILYDNVQNSYKLDDVVSTRLLKTKQRAMFILEAVELFEVKPQTIKFKHSISKFGHASIKIAMQQILYNVSDYERFMVEYKKRNWIVRLFQNFNPYDTYWEYILNTTHDITRRKYSELNVPHIDAYDVNVMLDIASYELKD